MNSPPASFLDITFLSIVVGALAIAAISDLRRLEIPNWISVVLIASYIPASLLSEISYATIAVQFGVAAGLFVLGAIAYYFGLFGGGDVKLISALALWIPWQYFGQFIIYIALVGGVLACLIIVIAKLSVFHAIRKRISWINPESGYAQPIPYGVAIAAAGLLIIVQSDYQILQGF